MAFPQQFDPQSSSRRPVPSQLRGHAGVVSVQGVVVRNYRLMFSHTRGLIFPFCF